MSQNKARTPFDDPDNSGTDVPLSKSTQPLPSPSSLLGSLQSGTPTGHAATTPPAQPAAYPPAQPAAYPPTQPPAYPPTQPLAYPPAQPPTYPPTQPLAYPPVQPAAYPSAQPPAYPVAPTIVTTPPAPTIPSAPTTRLKVPLPTLIGLAAVGGVVLAIGVPALMRRAIPPAPMKSLPPAVAAAPPVVDGPDGALDAPKAPQRPVPPRATARATSQSSVEEPAGAQSPTSSPDSPGDSAGHSNAGEDSPSAPESGSPDAGDAGDAGADAAPPSRSPKNVDEEDGQGNADDSPAPAPRGSQATVAAGSPRSGRGRSAGLGYSITAPEGWRKTQGGQRSIWAGPGGAQLLVEVASDVTSSPRADWEKLDRAFTRKYGRRYRSLGIREAQLAGRRGAAWEFELEAKGGGTTRKLDVAAHASGRGYAVLGSAPAEDFDALRPQIEAAIDSFQLGAGDDSDSGKARDEPEHGF